MSISKLIERISKYKRSVNYKPTLSKSELIYASKLRYEALYYNFDWGYQGLYDILESPWCDKSIALLLFWMNRPLFFLNNPEANAPINQEGKRFYEYLKKRISNHEFKEILNFKPMKFIDYPMNMSSELIEKSVYLDRIPIECFLPVIVNENITIFYKEVPNRTSLKKTKILYLVEFEEFDKLNNIDGIKDISELYICTDPYNRVKPPKRNISVLQSFENITKLHLDYYARFKKLDGLFKFKKLRHLAINVDTEDCSIFKDLQNLKSLEYTSGKAVDLEDIKNLFQLEKLVITGCSNLTDISKIKNLSNLKILEIKHSKKLKNISSIFETKITTLIFKEVQISSRAFHGLKEMNLEVIQLDCKKIKNIDFLPINSLKEINLYQLSTNPDLKEKITKTDLGNCKIVERDWNNAL